MPPVQRYRCTGCFTKVGLGTFIDPRNGGGKVNDVTKEDIIELVNIKGQDYLFYPAFPINVALIRGTYADESGNISFEKEVSPLEGTSVCQAVKQRRYRCSSGRKTG